MSKYKPREVDARLYRASIQFVENSQNKTNQKAIEKIREKGYIKKAVVTNVTKINDLARITVRADGAKIEFEIDASKLDLVYENPVKYSEQYIWGK